ncbi:MAG TPA: hypothetical protein VFP17_10230 [Solirubrobacterales bacterium]|nr:hypothetical protein [Solirubrobacterales bacterium]
MDLARTSSKRIATTFALAMCAAVTALALTAAAPASAATCPSFQVLHNDRIGAASFPAGSYEMTVDTGLSCKAASQWFARFLEDYDGVLPKPWRVVAEGSGIASFVNGSGPGFTVSRSGGGGGEGGGNNVLGKLCPGSFTVNAGSRVGPLLFPKGQYLIYIPARSGISCRRASVLFTRFLAAPGGMLPFPWRLKNQTATFYKPAHPERSAFRIEPIAGA